MHVLLREDLELFYDRAPCGYLSLTPDGLVVNVNQTFLEWSGYRRDQLVGERRLVDLLTVGGRIYHDTHFAPMVTMQGFAREIALEMVCADGSRLPILVNASLDRDRNGHPALIRVALLDATERHAYEQELLLAKIRAEESEARARSLAETLQQALIPPVPPAVPGLDIAAGYRPAGAGDEVGGDFYDVFQIDEDEWVVVLGDVCGKGVAAAVVTTLVRHTLRSAGVQHTDPSEALRVLDRTMREQGTDRFCTAAVLRLRRHGDGWHLDLSLGGHPPPLLVAPGQDPVPVGTTGSLVGLLEQPVFRTTSVDAGPGSLLVLYTDGVPEARGNGDFYGEDRLRSVVGRVSDRPAAEVVHSLLGDVLDFQQQRARDDIAVVVLRVPATAAG
jgi:sigma-B regulation protein RsbU (phosphoserine phosphatase)